MAVPSSRVGGSALMTLSSTQLRLKQFYMIMAT